MVQIQNTQNDGIVICKYINNSNNGQKSMKVDGDGGSSFLLLQR